MIEIGVPTGFDRTFGIAVSSWGEIVGAVSDSADKTGTFYGYYWFGDAAIGLTSVLSTPNSSADVAHDINEQGQIICDGRLDGQVVNLRLTPRPVVPGDATCDERVNVSLLAVINNWGPCSACHADLDGNGVVNVWDLIIVVHNWSP